MEAKHRPRSAHPFVRGTTAAWAAVRDRSCAASGLGPTSVGRWQHHERHLRLKTPPGMVRGFSFGDFGIALDFSRERKFIFAWPERSSGIHRSLSHVTRSMKSITSPFEV